MNNLVLLLKVQFSGLLTNTTQFSKKKKFAGIGSLLFLGALFLYMSVVYTISMVMTFPEGYQYLIADAPEGYLDNFVAALTSVYGYTKVSDTVYVNAEVGLQIELKEDTGYQQFYFTVVE